MAFKVVIADMLGVKVEGKYRDEDGADKVFAFTLVCKRLSADDMQVSLSNKTETILQFFERVTTDWRNQQLVLDDDGKPAAFGIEALRVLMNVAGMANTCWSAYLNQIAVTAKN